MRYPAPHSSVLLTSTGTWSFVVIAICACCAAVGFLWRHPAGKENGRFAGGSGIGPRNRSIDQPLQIRYRRGSPDFRWDQIGLEHLRAAERPADIPSV